IDQSPCSLEALLELSARQEAAGLGDAPWPPHYAKQAGEPPRVQPSRRKGGAKPSGRRVPKKPLVEIGRAAKKEEALAGLERWKARHSGTAAHLQPADVLVDSMRGRSSTWTRVRVNLEHVPEALRPAPEPLDPDDEPGWSSPTKRGRPPSARSAPTVPTLLGGRKDLGWHRARHARRNEDPTGAEESRGMAAARRRQIGRATHDGEARPRHVEKIDGRRRSAGTGEPPGDEHASRATGRCGLELLTRHGEGHRIEVELAGGGTEPTTRVERLDTAGRAAE